MLRSGSKLPKNPETSLTHFVDLSLRYSIVARTRDFPYFQLANRIRRRLITLPETMLVESMYFSML